MLSLVRFKRYSKKKFDLIGAFMAGIIKCALKLFTFTYISDVNETPTATVTVILTRVIT